MPRTRRAPFLGARQATVAESPPALTAAQLHALLDILTHSETYREVERFKDPTACAQYGYPFSNNDGDAPAPVDAPSACPIQQLLLKKLVLTLPPVRALPAQFWSLRMQGLLTGFAEAGLSESYEKGAMGTRKTLATGASAIIEIASRGCLGGCPGAPIKDFKSRAYDRRDAGNLARAWNDAVRQLVYGDLIRELFDFAAQNENLEEHSPAVRASAEWIILQLAGFLHQVCVVSPDGPYIIKLIENVHKLTPYSLVRRTLRVGNAATMISGLMKLLLAKMSVGGITNFIGLTKNADDGMNLLQRIISMVLHWDSADFRKSADVIEKATDGPPDECLSAIRDHLHLTQLEREAARLSSMRQGESIVTTILNARDPRLSENLSGTHHSRCMEYYSILLSIRDRDEITNILCHQNPDLFTQTLKEALAALDPLLRELHEKIDLHEHIYDAEEFVGRFIKTARGTMSNGTEWVPPRIQDFVTLLQGSKHFMYKWLHRVASQTPGLRDTFRDWAVEAIKTFRNPATDVSREGGVSTAARTPGGPDSSHMTAGAGAMNGPLRELFASLCPETQALLRPILDAHGSHLRALSKQSIKRIQIIIDDLGGDDGSSTPEAANTGPGLYLSRWRQLMDETVITSATAHGPVREGRDVRDAMTQGKTGAGVASARSDRNGRRSREASPTPAKVTRRPAPAPEVSEGPRAPDTRLVVESLGDRFRELLADKAKSV